MHIFPTSFQKLLRKLPTFLYIYRFGEVIYFLNQNFSLPLSSAEVKEHLSTIRMKLHNKFPQIRLTLVYFPTNNCKSPFKGTKCVCSFSDKNRIDEHVYIYLGRASNDARLRGSILISLRSDLEAREREYARFCSISILSKPMLHPNRYSLGIVRRVLLRN